MLPLHLRRVEPRRRKRFSGNLLNGLSPLRATEADLNSRVSSSVEARIVEVAASLGSSFFPIINAQHRAPFGLTTSCSFVRLAWLQVHRGAPSQRCFVEILETLKRSNLVSSAVQLKGLEALRDTAIKALTLAGGDELLAVSQTEPLLRVLPEEVAGELWLGITRAVFSHHLSKGYATIAPSVVCLFVQQLSRYIRSLNTADAQASAVEKNSAAMCCMASALAYHLNSRNLEADHSELRFHLHKIFGLLQYGLSARRVIELYEKLEAACVSPLHEQTPEELSLPAFALNSLGQILEKQLAERQISVEAVRRLVERSINHVEELRRRGDVGAFDVFASEHDSDPSETSIVVTSDAQFAQRSLQSPLEQAVVKLAVGLRNGAKLLHRLHDFEFIVSIVENDRRAFGPSWQAADACLRTGRPFEAMRVIDHFVVSVRKVFTKYTPQPILRTVVTTLVALGRIASVETIVDWFSVTLKWSIPSLTRGLILQHFLQGLAQAADPTTRFRALELVTSVRSVSPDTALTRRSLAILIDIGLGFKTTIPVDLDQWITDASKIQLDEMRYNLALSSSLPTPACQSKLDRVLFRTCLFGFANAGRGHKALSMLMQAPPDERKSLGRPLLQKIQESVVKEGVPDAGFETEADQLQTMQEEQSLADLISSAEKAPTKFQSVEDPWACLHCRSWNSSLSTVCRCGAAKWPKLRCRVCHSFSDKLSPRCATCEEQWKGNERELVVGPWKCNACAHPNTSAHPLFCRECDSPNPALGRVEPSRCLECSFVDPKGVHRPWCPQCGKLDAVAQRTADCRFSETARPNKGCLWSCGECGTLNPWIDERCRSCKCYPDCNTAVLPWYQWNCEGCTAKNLAWNTNCYSCAAVRIRPSALEILPPEVNEKPTNSLRICPTCAAVGAGAICTVCGRALDLAKKTLLMDDSRPWFLPPLKEDPEIQSSRILEDSLVNPPDARSVWLCLNQQCFTVNRHLSDICDTCGSTRTFSTMFQLWQHGNSLWFPPAPLPESNGVAAAARWRERFRSAFVALSESRVNISFRASRLKSLVESLPRPITSVSRPEKCSHCGSWLDVRNLARLCTNCWTLAPVCRGEQNLALILLCRVKAVIAALRFLIDESEGGEHPTRFASLSSHLCGDLQRVAIENANDLPWQCIDASKGDFASSVLTPVHDNGDVHEGILLIRQWIELLIVVHTRHDARCESNSTLSDQSKMCLVTCLNLVDLVNATTAFDELEFSLLFRLCQVFSQVNENTVRTQYLACMKLPRRFIVADAYCVVCLGNHPTMMCSDPRRREVNLDDRCNSSTDFDEKYNEALRTFRKQEGTASEKHSSSAAVLRQLLGREKLDDLHITSAPSTHQVPPFHVFHRKDLGVKRAHISFPRDKRITLEAKND